MRITAALATLSLFLTIDPGFAAQAGAPASHARMPARPVISAPSPACLQPGLLLSHAAYLPTAVENTARCGQLLSTDTVLSVHHWDQT